MLGEYDVYHQRIEILQKAREVVEFAHAIERRLALVGDCKDEDVENIHIDKIRDLLHDIENIQKGDVKWIE